MFRIIFTILLITQNYLIAMEPLSIISMPSNSSSEVYLFIKHIAHNLTAQDLLPKEIKVKILTTYIAITNEERIASIRYNELIDIPDYMNLNKENKHYIQMLFSTNTPMRIDDINNNKNIILTAFPNAQTHYQKMLGLPQNVRRKIADKYFPMILVNKIGIEHWMNESQIADQEITKVIKSIPISIGIISATMKTLDYFQFISVPDIFFIPLVSIVSGLATPIIVKELYEKIDPLTTELKYRYHDAYELLPLVPEDNEKKTEKF